jgi:hypothetical protein
MAVAVVSIRVTASLRSVVPVFMWRAAVIRSAGSAVVMAFWQSVALVENWARAAA